MARKISVAVEDDLSNVSQELERRGYEVMDLEEDNLQKVDAIVISGEDKNVMNMSDIKNEASVINADGLSAVEVSEELQNRI
ncbi:YkuS family protein [Acetohalobium arabaticum]|uniref:YkuS family protein n=1 Tax=Acetohalobium arabaticum (strain ATCC 49924 / DSM 5501 / Z-7288) TaxID=574087 RepID=D9QQ75_ACEAZ|nr:YkuS family protein [Acetohalobium arabaticum]ADL12666.1 protein of unknown function UPF0180 [Acetohalobium arabaticum DSM 5501]